MEATKQRMSMERIRAWERLRYGMFIHFGISTFDSDDHSMGDEPATLYAPSALDVEQWVTTAKEGGMKYVVLTTKHVSGFCLWPSKHTDYHVGNNGDTTDVVYEFVNACEKHDLRAGLYYCSEDNHNRKGSVTRQVRSTFKCQESRRMIELPFYSTREYREFQTAQIEELLTTYPNLLEFWVDLPAMLPIDYRFELYDRMAALAPDTFIFMNNGAREDRKLNMPDAWPTDIMAIERHLPMSCTTLPLEEGEEDPRGKKNVTGYTPKHTVFDEAYYIPGETCDSIGHEWFYMDNDKMRSDMELLGMYLVATERGTNYLLNVPPNREGVICCEHRDAVIRLRGNIEKVAGALL